jgi:Mg2+/Co2+ transporter CorB
MNFHDISDGALLTMLVTLIALSAYFSSTETAMMALNRYRLQHLTKEGHGGARIASRLLRRPDRLLGVILIGNNLVNFMAASLGTVIGLRYLGDYAIVISPVILTFVFLIFAEVAPKTLAAHVPESVAFKSVYVLEPLLRLLHPFVWVTNGIANWLVKPFARSHDGKAERLSPAELRTVVDEGAHLPGQHQGMMLGILDLEHACVEDIMVPRSEIVGINIDDDISEIMGVLRNSQHTRLPVYRENINHVIGVLHLRKLARYIHQGDLTKPELLGLVREPYFVPEATPLHTQLINFQKEKRRIALVVDEYGDVHGIVTLEDILEEIVGEFTSDYAANIPDIQRLDDGWYLIDGTAVLREINRALAWDLPIDGPKTLNGLVLEHLETLPDSNLCLILGDYRLETLQITDNLIKHLKVMRLEAELIASLAADPAARA